MTLFICIVLSFLALLAALLSMAMTLQAWHNRELGRVWMCGVTYGRAVERFEAQAECERVVRMSLEGFEAEPSSLERDPDWWKNDDGEICE